MSSVAHNIGISSEELSLSADLYSHQYYTSMEELHFRPEEEYAWDNFVSVIFLSGFGRIKQDL